MKQNKSALAVRCNVLLQWRVARTTLLAASLPRLAAFSEHENNLLRLSASERFALFPTITQLRSQMKLEVVTLHTWEFFFQGDGEQRMFFSNSRMIRFFFPLYH